MREDMTPADVLIVLDTENPICEESDSDEAYRIEIGDNGAVLTAASEMRHVWPAYDPDHDDQQWQSRLWYDH